MIEDSHIYQARGSGIFVVDNTAEIPGNDHPFEWIHQEVGTTFSGNTANGAPATFTEGVQPTINFHLFVLEIWAAP